MAKIFHGENFFIFKLFLQCLEHQIEFVSVPV